MSDYQEEEAARRRQERRERRSERLMRCESEQEAPVSQTRLHSPGPQRGPRNLVVGVVVDDRGGLPTDRSRREQRVGRGVNDRAARLGHSELVGSGRA